MVSCLHAHETFSPINRGSDSPDRSLPTPTAPSLALRPPVAVLGASGYGASGYATSAHSGEFAATETRRRPTLSPTVAPLGHERLIGVRSIHDRDVMVIGGATGRHYHFAAGQSREIPLSDARLLVAEGDFGFSGGR